MCKYGCIRTMYHEKRILFENFTGTFTIHCRLQNRFPTFYGQIYIYIYKIMKVMNKIKLTQKSISSIINYRSILSKISTRCIFFSVLEAAERTKVSKHDCCSIRTTYSSSFTYDFIVQRSTQ